MPEQWKTACLACYVNFYSSSSFCDGGKTEIFITGKKVNLCLYLDWIDLSQHRNQWRALVKTAMNLLVP
jgi:hypothetical protein